MAETRFLADPRDSARTDGLAHAAVGLEDLKISVT
jgi:hypothetical protein